MRFFKIRFVKYLYNSLINYFINKFKIKNYLFFYIHFYYNSKEDYMFIFKRRIMVIIRVR